MITLRSTSFLFTVATLLSLAQGAAAQHRPGSQTASAPAAVSSPKSHEPVVAESLSGLDLIPNRKTGMFGIRISHRLTQPATLRLIDVKTGRFVKTELLEPSAAPMRAVQVGRLAYGEYKMEVVMTDTTYWKTVRVSR